MKSNNERKKKTKKSLEKIIIPISFYESEAGSLYEEIYNPETKNASFISWDQPPHKAGSLKIFSHIDIGKKRLVPIMDDALKEKAVLLPTLATDYQDIEILIQEIKEHIHKYSDISDYFETITAWYILLTWVYDKVNTLPYLRVIGDSGTGKSRFLDVTGRLCYKPMIVSGAITPAPIYRMIRKWRGTLILDEADLRKSDEKNEVVTVLNCGFERGRPVIRSQKDNPDDLQILPTFSPKVLATRKRFRDTALESRCLTEIMKETNRDDIPSLLPKCFYREEMDLRNKLLMFRLKNRNKVDTEKAQGLDLGEVEPRLKQTMSSFAVLFSTIDGVMETFKDFLWGYNRDLIEERSQSFDGMIVNSIYELGGVTDVTNVTDVTGTDYPLKDITSSDIAHCIKNKYDFETTPQTIGRHLKTLGLTTKPKRIKDEVKRILVWDKNKLNKLFRRYVVTAVTNETNVTHKFDESLDQLPQPTGLTDSRIKKIVNVMIEEPSREWFIGHLADRVGMDSSIVKNLLLDVTSNPTNPTPIRMKNRMGDSYILDGDELHKWRDNGGGKDIFDGHEVT